MAKPALVGGGQRPLAAAAQAVAACCGGLYQLTEVIPVPIDPGRWAALMDGSACPFCREMPDDNLYSLKVADLACSTLWLEKDQRFRGYCVLILNRHATELTQLAPAEANWFYQDLLRAMRAIETAMRPDKMNACLLGNTVPHLHWHITPRYVEDPRWNEPHWADWDRRGEVAVTLSEEDYAEIAGAIRAGLTL
jgi:diadenosine tetraphosphate (Ap4A) HIT family hydrolase